LSNPGEAGQGTGSDDPVGGIPTGYQPLAKWSAFGRIAGPVYQKRGPDGRVLGFRVAEKHLNLGGVAHGGALATFADIVLGQFEGRDYSTVTVTVRLTVDFIAPARAGDWVEGRVEVTGESGDILFAEATITCRGRLLVRASGVFKALPRKRG
jgi:acyl-coenzyme A thioesterase PaaI-like protein